MDSKRSFKLANTKEARAYIILGESPGMINQRYVRMMLFEVRCIAVDFSAIEIGYKCGNLVSVLKDREAWTMQGKPVWLIEAEIATVKSEDKLSDPKLGK